MTFIQPNKNSRVRAAILFSLLFLLAASAFYLIVIYNRVVNFEHGVVKMKRELNEIEAQNIDHQNKIFSLIDSSKSESLSSGILIQEKNPKYLEVRWAYASQY